MNIGKSFVEGQHRLGRYVLVEVITLTGTTVVVFTFTCFTGIVGRTLVVGIAHTEVLAEAQPIGKFNLQESRGKDIDRFQFVLSRIYIGTGVGRQPEVFIVLCMVAHINRGRIQHGRTNDTVIIRIRFGKTGIRLGKVDIQAGI